MLALIIILLALLSCGVTLRPGEVAILGREPRATFITYGEQRSANRRYNDPHSMIQARYPDLDLKEIPKNLRTDIQILDFSANRLRKLTKETLGAYTSLVYLHLQDNFIRTIEEGSFDRLDRLELIDLTNNAIRDIPKTILGLPYLRNLFLSENMLSDYSFAPGSITVDSNLEFLDLSKNQLRTFPSLGSLPTLEYLNLSFNLIESVTTKDLALFCSLENLDLTENYIKFNVSSCDCENFNNWIEIRGIKMKPLKFDCAAEHKNPGECVNSTAKNLLPKINETIRIFDSCRNLIIKRAETLKARSTWILVGSCLAALLGLSIVILYCIHKRNNREKKHARDSNKSSRLPLKMQTPKERESE